MSPQPMITENADFSITPVIGGAQRKTYWTPDGRSLQLIPQLRESSRKDNKGNVIWSGTRDANYDKGYLTHPPSESERKVFCRWCGWHDTQEQVDACKVANEKLEAQREATARQELANEGIQKDLEIDKLNERIEQLEKLIKEKLGG